MADTTVPAPAGLHFDDLHKLRVLEPDTCEETQALRDECKEFVDKFSEFQGIVDSFMEMTTTLAKEVEREKMKAIGARNLLKSIEKQREAKKQQLQALIAEKRIQLERYRVQCQSLQKMEAEQRDFVENFSLQK